MARIGIKEEPVIFASNIPVVDPLYPLYDPLTPYSEKVVIQTSDGRLWKQAWTAPITGIDPTVDNPEEWSFYGVTNYKACLDPYTQTSTVSPDIITYEFTVSDIDTVLLLGIEAKEVTITLYDDDNAGAIVYQKTEITRKRIVADWFDYIYAKPEFIREAFFLLDVMINTARLKVDIKFLGDTAKIGHIAYAQSRDVGFTTIDQKPKITLKTLAVKTRNKYTGVIDTNDKPLIIKRIEVGIFLENSSLDIIRERLNRYMGLGVILIADDRDGGHKSLAIYGIYQEVTLPIGVTTTHYQIKMDGFI